MSNIRKYIATCAIASAVLPALALFMSHPSSAASAFAAGIPDDVAQKGVALGEGYNYPTREQAEARAMSECTETKDADAEVHALCKIIDHFDGRCLAVALDPKAGTPGWGWAIADTANDVNDQALSQCRASAGADRAPYCTITISVCDGK